MLRAKDATNPDLVLPPKPVPPYVDQIAEEIRRLHAEFPAQGPKWIADKVGQPRHVVISVLGDWTLNGGDQ